MVVKFCDIMKERSIQVSEISKILDTPFIGDDVCVQGLNLCNRSTRYDSVLSYITSVKYISLLCNNKAIKVLFVSDSVYDELKKNESIQIPALFVVSNPEVSFYHLHHKLYEETGFYNKYNFKSEIGIDCNIHKTAVIEDGVILGNYVRIGANSVIRRGTIIGNRTIIGCCSVVGSEGFQLIYNENQEPFTVTHVGGTTIGDNVLIGDNCTICNSLFEGYVVIGNNSKIDNQVHIGHNCLVGENTVITGNSLLMGSVEIKNNVWISPCSSISNKCIIYDNAFVGSNSLVVNNVRENMRVCGNPAVPENEYFRILVNQKKSIKNKKDER